MCVNLCGKIFVLITSIIAVAISDGPSFDFVEAIEEVETIAPNNSTVVIIITNSSYLPQGIEAYDDDRVRIEAKDFSLHCGSTEKCASELSTQNYTEGEVLRLGSKPVVLRYEQIPFQCRCDRNDCVDYGDCCYTVLVGQSVNKERNTWRCNKFHEKDGTNVLMISQCPTESSATLKDLCSADRTDPDIEYNYLMDIPVYSTGTKYLYRNIYCARCHGEKNPSLFQWNTRLYCNVTMTMTEQEEFIQNATYIPGERYLVSGNRLCGIYIGDLFNSSKTIESFIPNVRYCGSNSIETCPKNYGKNDKQKRTAHLCVSYTQHVKAKGGLVYKNPHCALCNGVQLNHWDIERNITIPNVACYQSTVIMAAFFPKIPSHHSGPGIQLLFDFSLDIHENVVGYNTIFCAKDLHEGFMSRFSVVLNYVSMISLAISVIFSILHILLYMLLPKLRNLPGKNLLCLTISLLISQLIFLTLINHSRWQGLCVAAAIAVHYFYLAAFFWMNVMSFDMWRTFTGITILSRNQSLERKQITFLKYSIFSWITPFVIVSIAIVVEFLPEIYTVEPEEDGRALLDILEKIKPSYGQNGFCWIGQRLSLFVFFAAPVALIVISNLILFSLTAKAILSQNKEAGKVLQNRDSVKAKKDMHGNSDVVKAKLYAKLALIMGLTWILGFISNFSGWNWLWIVFVLFNGLQGTFIFFAFDFKWKILEMLVDKGKRIPCLLVFMKLCKCVRESDNLESERSGTQTSNTVRTKSRSISFSGTTSTYADSK
ncbi:unnamed protein product [Allacma fusca]|uniref:G-protein coupled receptors family 2 profile 2 domain-containing protein n=1 Tax=Allacma fusca TaxID=39272 RepID=A0A8J2JLJ2_9HEXA|nr:unnamed protein product [Allacma fusca]